MENNSSLAPVLLVVGLAFLVPLILSRFKRLRLPVVVGEIIAGMIIGRSGLQLVESDPTLEVLAALGFAFLMFLSGAEIDFSMLAPNARGNRSNQGNPLMLGLLILALTILLASAVGIVLANQGLVRSPWLMGLILSTTSLGIVVPVLREQGLSSTRYGQTLLLSALTADFVTMVLITVVVAVLSGGLTLQVMLVGVLLLAFLLAVRFARRITRWPPIRRMLDEVSHTTVQIKVRGALAVMFAFVVLSQVLGAEVILGAFLAGALIALISTPEDIEAQSKLDAIGFGFIIPIFFIMVGIRFDLPALLASTEALILFPILLVAAYLVKIVPSLVLRRYYTWRQTLAAGVLLSTRLSLIVAASAIGLNLGLISEAINADIVLVAIVTSTLSPALFARLAPAAREEPKHMILVGAGHPGLMLARRLAQHNEPFLMVDASRERVQRAQGMGYQAVQADPTTSAGLAAAGLERARALAITTGDDEFNLRVCRAARSVFGAEHIVAAVQDVTRAHEFEAAGARVVNPSLASATVIDGLLRYPDMFTLMSNVEDDKELVEIAMGNPDLHGRELRSLHLPGDVLILALRRKGDTLVPHGHTQLQLDDRLTLAGAITAVQEAAFLLGSR